MCGNRCLVQYSSFGVGLDRLAKRNLRRLSIDVELVAAMQPLTNDLQVQLAHAGRDQLLGLRVAIEPECRIFLHDLVQRSRELCFVVAALGRDG
jgi:hypothetical protein